MNEIKEAEIVEAEVIETESVMEAAEPKPMELVILKNDIDFAWNFQEIKTAVSDYIQRYVGLVVTENNLKDMEAAQKEVAGIRLKIDGFRKEVRKRLNEPYDKFNTEIKELQELIKKAEEPLKLQTAEYEVERVKQKEQEWIDFASTTAANLGLRIEYFNFTVNPQWTNRSAVNKTVRKEIVTAIEDMLSRQRMADEAAELQRQRVELIAGFCVSKSQVFMLKTPVTPEDIQHLVEHAALAEIPGIITQECQKRAEMERKAAEPVIMPVSEPVPETPVQAATGGIVPEGIVWEHDSDPGDYVDLSCLLDQRPPEPPAYQANIPSPPPMPPRETVTPEPPPMPPTPSPVPPTPPTPPPELWDADMHIYAITVAKAEMLKAFMSQNNIVYSFDGFKRRG